MTTPLPLLVTRHQLSIRRIAARICFCALDDSTVASLLAKESAARGIPRLGTAAASGKTSSAGTHLRS